KDLASDRRRPARHRAARGSRRDRENAAGRHDSKAYASRSSSRAGLVQTHPVVVALKKVDEWPAPTNQRTIPASAKQPASSVMCTFDKPLRPVDPEPGEVSPGKSLATMAA